MIEIISKILDFLSNNSKGLLRYFTSLVVLSLVVFLFDYSFEISKGWEINRKAEQLDKLNTLKQNYDGDSTVQGFIEESKHEILIRTHYSLKLKEWYNYYENTANRKYSYWIMLLSSSWFFITLIIIIPILGGLAVYIEADYTKSQAIDSVKWLVISFLAIPIVTRLSFLVPMYLGNPIWNYIFNFVSTLLIVLIWVFVVKGKDESEIIELIGKDLKNVKPSVTNKQKILESLNGAWADMDDSIIEEIYSSRTISDREINLD